MFVILCYDVEAKRVGRMLKTAKKYLHPVQRSVLEGDLTLSMLHRMQDEMASIVCPERDSVVIYCTQTAGQMEKLQLGRFEDDDGGFL